MAATDWAQVIRQAGGAATWPLISKALQSTGAAKGDADVLAQQIVMGKQPIPPRLPPPSLFASIDMTTIAMIVGVGILAWMLVRR